MRKLRAELASLHRDINRLEDIAKQEAIAGLLDKLHGVPVHQLLQYRKDLQQDFFSAFTGFLKQDQLAHQGSDEAGNRDAASWDLSRWIRDTAARGNELASVLLELSNRVTGPVGRVMQGAGALQNILGILCADKVRHDPKATREDRENAEEDGLTGFLSLMYEVATELVESAAERTLMTTNRMTSAVKKLSVPMGTSVAARQASRVMALSRFNGVMNLLGLPFDIVALRRALSDLRKAKTPQERQAAMHNRNLSVAGLILTFSTGIMALCGISAAGPLGLLAGVGLFLTGGIISARAAMEQIEKQIPLSNWEKLENSLRVIFPLGLTWGV